MSQNFDFKLDFWVQKEPLKG